MNENRRECEKSSLSQLNSKPVLYVRKCKTREHAVHIRRGDTSWLYTVPLWRRWETKFVLGIYKWRSGQGRVLVWTRLLGARKEFVLSSWTDPDTTMSRTVPEFIQYYDYFRRTPHTVRKNAEKHLCLLYGSWTVGQGKESLLIRQDPRMQRELVGSTCPRRWMYVSVTC